MSSFQSINTLVNDNTSNDFLTASRILIKFASNILENPNDDKFRKIKLSNPTVQTKLLNVSGGMECLFEMGFGEDDEFLTLEQGTSLQPLMQMKIDLEKERERIERNIADNNQQCAAAPNPSQNQQPTSFQLYTRTEPEFAQRLRAGISTVMAYENRAAQEKARRVMPIDELRKSAQDSLEANKENPKSLEKPYDFRDFLLLALLKWFKTSFFKWVNTLPCSFCNGVTQHAGSAQPSPEDLVYGAGRVEAHKCNDCNRITRFPRYGSAEKLLESRMGRCGEWANCFTLCCRALDFEARYVLDWTDHVWTEVFSLSQDRWLHCDPCENIMDKPLLYESGWGKKLSYVIAFAKDDIRDVSWRYSAKHKELMSRRALCREQWLVSTIHKLRLSKISGLSEGRKHELNVRLVKEVVSFLSVKDSGSEVLPGRSTGSLEWRQARGELGSGTQSAAQNNKSFLFIPTEEENENKFMHICYSCVKDKYIRKSSRNNEDMISWLACTNTCSGVQRKEEFDWKMVYLAREEGIQSSEVSWKFQIIGNRGMNKLELKACSTVFEGATVSWRICAGDNCFMQDGPSLQEFQSFDLKGSKTLTITAVLKGGKGDNAWQHTQLFRQPLTDVDDLPFEVKIYFS